MTSAEGPAAKQLGGGEGDCVFGRGHTRQAEGPFDDAAAHGNGSNHDGRGPGGFLGPNAPAISRRHRNQRQKREPHQGAAPARAGRRIGQGNPVRCYGRLDWKGD